MVVVFRQTRLLWSDDFLYHLELAETKQLHFNRRNQEVDVKRGDKEILQVSLNLTCVLAALEYLS